MTTASATADNKLPATVAVKPECDKAKPPLRPNAINKYSDKNREMAGGISKFDLRLAATTPKTKNKMAGSVNICMMNSFIWEIVGQLCMLVKSIIKDLFIDFYLCTSPSDN